MRLTANCSQLGLAALEILVDQAPTALELDQREGAERSARPVARRGRQADRRGWAVASRLPTARRRSRSAASRRARASRWHRAPAAAPRIPGRPRPWPALLAGRRSRRRTTAPRARLGRSIAALGGEVAVAAAQTHSTSSADGRRMRHSAPSPRSVGLLAATTTAATACGRRLPSCGARRAMTADQSWSRRPRASSAARRAGRRRNRSAQSGRASPSRSRQRRRTLARP